MTDGVAAADRRVTLHGYDFDSGEMREFTFSGRLLGEGTSHNERHVALVHDPGSYAPPGERCSACRWFEVRVYVALRSVTPSGGGVDPHDGYYVETVGRSIVPGEVDRRRVRRVREPRRVVATLVQEKDGRVFVPAPSRHALDQASDRDERLADVVDTLLELD